MKAGRVSMPSDVGTTMASGTRSTVVISDKSFCQSYGILATMKGMAEIDDAPLKHSV